MVTKAKRTRRINKEIMQKGQTKVCPICKGEPIDLEVEYLRAKVTQLENKKKEENEMRCKHMLKHIGGEVFQCKKCNNYYTFTSRISTFYDSFWFKEIRFYGKKEQK